MDELLRAIKPDLSLRVVAAVTTAAGTPTTRATAPGTHTPAANSKGPAVAPATATIQLRGAMTMRAPGTRSAIRRSEP